MPGIKTGIGGPGMVRHGALSNLLQYRVTETKPRIANSNITYDGPVLMVGSGQTYTTISAAAAAAPQGAGNILHLVPGVYNLDSEPGGYLMLNDPTKGFKIRCDINTVELISSNAIAAIRLRDCLSMTFENLKIKATGNIPVIMQNIENNSTYVKFLNCEIINDNLGGFSSILARQGDDSASLKIIRTEFESCKISAKYTVFAYAQRGINDTILITNCEILSEGGIAIKYQSSNKGTLAIYDCTIVQNNNAHILHFGEDNFTFTNTIKLIDVRSNTFSYSTPNYGHLALFGAGTDNVCAVNNTCSQPAVNQTLSLGFVIKTMATAIGNAYFAGNKVTAARPFYVKGGKNVIVKYNTFISNDVNWHSFEVMNPDSTALSTGNVIRKNNFIGSDSVICSFLSGSWELAEETMKGWDINENIYVSEFNRWFKKADLTYRLFSERSEIWINENDSLSKMKTTYKLSSGFSLITDNTILN